MALVPLSRDPFGIPGYLIPAGMIYQWCSKEPSANFQKYLDAGWTTVPFARHEAFFDAERYAALDGSIAYGGCVLMERPREQSQESREKDMDQACLNAGQGRQVAVNVTVNVRLTHGELSDAKASSISGQAWAQSRILQIADGASVMQIHGRDGALRFVFPQPPAARRRPKWPWLSWLFDLISTEEPS